MSYFRQHIFFCCNQRDGGRPCCSSGDATELRDYCKGRVKKLALAGKGRVRINMAGCLDRCEEGPVIVIYPEGVWYRYESRGDIDEIVEKHLLKGQVVERLRI